MKHYTKNEIRHIVQEEEIKFLHLLFTDIHGNFKNIEVPISQLEKVLNNEMFFDGSSIDGFATIDYSDMILSPDLNTWLIYPWQHDKGKTARIICDIFLPDGTPFKGDPRGQLKQSLHQMKQLGFATFNIGPEPEFFLLDLDENGSPLPQTNDTATYADVEPIDKKSLCRRDIVLTLEKMGFNIEASHHEVAFGQHEINFQYANAIETCDNIQTFKMVVHRIAQAHGLHATFMPKPFNEANGSGMHWNMSLIDQHGNNIFYDSHDQHQLSKEAYEFIAGLLKHAQAFSAICNPTVNSYKRLLPGYEAPVYLSWSCSNRTAMIRIPAAREMRTRIELRSVDPSANPYLASLTLLESGLNGIKHHLPCPLPCDFNIFNLSEKERQEAQLKSLPHQLNEAISFLENDSLLLDALGSHLSSQFIQLKKQEWQRYQSYVTDWGWQHYHHI